ncbi:type II secretion system F family protein [Lacisediminihabitans sp.]|uniref:type II secretion system F family protein n=1 Tax=Lacisediminihabitans sp. TaxID=2787631 RepID=UPI00374D4820
MARETVGVEPIASFVQRLGVLLAAGVAPSSGWGYLAEAAVGPEAARLRSIADSVAAGASIADAVLAVAPSAGRNEPVWRGIAAAWQVATDAGAPLAPTLAELAASLRALAQNEEDLRSALAGPAATARMVVMLPVVGVLFGLVLGFDSLSVLFATPPGLVCLALGVTLMLAARWWSRRLVDAARPTQLTPGLSLDLMAIAVSGGAALPRAIASVSEAWARFGLDDDGGRAAIDEVLSLSRRAGVPAAALLRSEAAEARRAARSAGERRAATVAVTLMLPLGVCVLPAFMLLGVAPLLIAVLSSTVAGI